MLATRALILLETGDAFGARRDADVGASLAPASPTVAGIRARVDLRSLAVAAEPCSFAPDATVDVPKWLWSRRARATREGAIRALRHGQRDSVLAVLGEATTSDDRERTATTLLGALSASARPARRPAGR